MNEEPWDDDGAPAELGPLLRAARAERPRSRVVRSALAAAAAGSVVLTAKGSAALSLVSVLKWGIGGIALGSLVSVGSVGLRYASAPAQEPQKAPRSVAASASTRATVALATPAEAPPPPSAAPDPVSSGFAGPAAADAKRTAAAGRPGRLLEQELALVDSIRVAIDARDFSRALALLDTHERRFGRSAPLAPEARYLRMEALRLAGQADSARDVAQQILSGDADGPHRERAKSVLGRPPE